VWINEKDTAGTNNPGGQDITATLVQEFEASLGNTVRPHLTKKKIDKPKHGVSIKNK
jgi:hypothetical protein